MKRVGAFVASSFGILGIDLLAGALPHTLSASARESLRFLSRNILNSRTTRKGTRGRALAAIQPSNTSARGHSHFPGGPDWKQLKNPGIPQGFGNTSKSEGARGQQGWPAMLLGALTMLRGQTAGVMLQCSSTAECSEQDQADHSSKLGSQTQSQTRSPLVETSQRPL